MSRLARPRRRTRALAGTIVLGVVTALAAPSALSAAAQTAPLSYEARAAADGLRLEVRTPGLFLSNLFDGGLPVAQAHSNDLGTSEGFAAMPYRGESVAAISTLLLPLLGLPALPPYPLEASATHPSQPEVTSSAGAFVIAATGRGDGASGSVTAGVSAGDLRSAYLEVSAKTSADPTTGEVVARGRTLLQGLSLARVISIGRVEASAEVTGGSDGEVVMKSAFEVEGLSVAGVQLAVTDKGVVLLGAGGVPLPDLQLRQILQQAGISVQYLKATELDGGVISAGLEITLPVALPPPYDLTVTITLGRARAVADVAAGSDASDEVPVDIGGGTAMIDSPVFNPVEPGAGASVASPRVEPRTRTVSNIGALDVSVISFYLVLVAAAIVALVSVALIRRFGVKLAWTS